MPGQWTEGLGRLAWKVSSRYRMEHAFDCVKPRARLVQ